MRRSFSAFALWAVLGLACSGAAPPPTVPVPLDPAGLDGAAVFTAAEDLAARAARAADLDFSPDPRPHPPRIILLFDTPDGRIARRNGVLFWRGDMLPDQLAPAESGLLLRRKRQSDGSWKTTRTRRDAPPVPPSPLEPAAFSFGSGTLPGMLIETPYRLGTAGTGSADLLLWRTPEEGSPPVGGAIVLQDASSAWIDSLRDAVSDFDEQDAWLEVFRALAP